MAQILKSIQTPMELVEIKRCPLCDRDAARPIFQLDKISVYQCQCGLKFISPCLSAQAMMGIYHSSETLQELRPILKDYYEYEVLNPASRTYQDYVRVLQELSVLASGRRFFEAGCGRGKLLALARERGWEVNGVDSSPENIQELQKLGIPASRTDYLGYFSEDKFDVVVLWDLIEHPQNPKANAYIRKSWSLLNSGGLLLLATPHYPNLLSLLAGFLYRISFGLFKFPVRQLYFLEHTTYFGERELRRLLEGGGFKVLKAWKSETDLERYGFPSVLRPVLRLLFAVARWVGLQNRILIIGVKIA